MRDRREIEREHAALRNEIGVIRRLIEDADPRSMLIQRLTVMCDLLARHVAQEEQDGYLDGVATRRPELEPGVAALRQDHLVLLDASERLRALLAAVTSLPLEVLRLLDQVGRHELAEHDLVRRAVLDDHAAGD